MRMRRTRVWP